MMRCCPFWLALLLIGCASRPREDHSKKTSAAPPSPYADFVSFAATNDFHPIVWRGEKTFKVGDIVPNHAQVFMRFPVEENAKGVVRYLLFSFNGPDSAGSICLSLEKSTGKVIEFQHVEATQSP